MNRREFAEQFQAIHGGLWLVAAGCSGDRTAADDIVQEAAVIAFQKRAEFRRGTNFAAWLTQIVRHCAANYRRKTVSRRTFATDPGDLDQVPATSAVDGAIDTLDDLSLDRLDLGDEWLHALRQLPEVACCCLLLRVIGGASYGGISQQLQIPEGTAMSHVHRSKKLLREHLRTRPESSEGVP